MSAITVDLSSEDTDELQADLEACHALRKIYPTSAESQVVRDIREGLDILIDAIEAELKARQIAVN